MGGTGATPPPAQSTGARANWGSKGRSPSPAPGLYPGYAGLPAVKTRDNPAVSRPDGLRRREFRGYGVSIPVHGEVFFTRCQQRDSARFPRGSSVVPEEYRPPPMAPPPTRQPAERQAEVSSKPAGRTVCCVQPGSYLPVEPLNQSPTDRATVRARKSRRHPHGTPSLRAPATCGRRPAN